MSATTVSLHIQIFNYYKSLAEKAITQVDDGKLDYAPDNKSNSIAVMVKHLHGNMLSRWTDFLTSDGEKEWRKRDEEFEEEDMSREKLMSLWNEGWACLFNALNALTEEDLLQIVYIRNMGQTVEEALNRQLAHYAYHVGQIVYVSRLLSDDRWTTLTIPKGQSNAYNKERFDKEKEIKSFTDDVQPK